MDSFGESAVANATVDANATTHNDDSPKSNNFKCKLNEIKSG